MTDTIESLRAEVARLKAEVLALSVALPTPRVILMLSSAVSHHPTLMADERADCMAALYELHKAYMDGAKGNARVHSTFDKEPSR